MRLVAAAAALLAALPARPCSVCGCGDPLLSASDPAASSGVLRLAAEAEYLRVTAANEDDPALTDRLDQYTLRLGAVYSPVPSLGLIAQLPIVRKDLATSGHTTSDLTGVGDLEIGARYVLVDRPDFARQRRRSFAVSAGTSVPTGARTATIHGVPVDEHGQLGTGAWGPYAGLHYRWEERLWTVFASVTGRLRTTNAERYHYGDSVLWSVHGQVWPWERLAVDLGVDGRWAAVDTRGPEPVPATGGAVLAAAPGLYWNVVGGWWASARAQLPFATWLVGRQGVDPTLALGVQYQLF